MAPAEVDAIVQQARQVYAHFGEEPPAPKKLRRAMITRVHGFTPTKVDMDKRLRCDGTVGGIGSDSINQSVSTKIRPGYKQKTAEHTEADNKRRREDADYRDKKNAISRESRKRVTTYRRIRDMQTEIDTGREYMHKDELDQMLEITCSETRWEQLGGRTIDKVMELPNFAQYTGITKQVPVSEEAFNFLVRGVGLRKNKTKTEVPPITHPDGSYIWIGEARALGFFTFQIFQSTAMFDCKRLEEKIQKRYDHLPYIEKILHKRAGNGADYMDVFSEHCCVYFTGIFNLQKLLDDGTVIVGDYEKSEEYYRNYHANRS